jgi:hypothetical protein
MSFQDELEKLVLNAALNGAYKGEGQRVLSRDVISTTLTSIINLVDKEVIGEDYPFMAETPDSTTWDVIPAAKNTLKAEQRAVIRGKDD